MLFAGAASSSEHSASLVVLRMAEITLIDAIVSEQVIAEVERNLAGYLPAALPLFRQFVDRCVRIVPDPSAVELAVCHNLADPKDAPILAAAVREECLAWVRAKSQDEEAKHLHWTYDDMPSEVRHAVKIRLVREQGGLCCYTGRSIRPETSHIEHMKPQARCVNHEDTDYNNLLAAHPASDAQRRCPYGAHEKGDWYNQHHFVHPLRQDCEQRFRYRDSGRVVAMSETDVGAAETIQRLQLDHPELQRMRKNAIDELEIEKLGKAKASRLMEAMDERNVEGNYRPFCFVIKQACERYLKRFEKPKVKR